MPAQASLTTARGSASGKAILLGEHVVVHGRPALSVGVARTVDVAVEPAPRREIEGIDDARVAQAVACAAQHAGIGEGQGFRIRVSGDLPIAMGLGSSAALSVALVRALSAAAGATIGADETARRAHELEKIFHRTPSGIDGATATHGGLLWFERGALEAVRPGGPASLVIALSGSRHETGATVGALRTRAAACPHAYEPVFDAIGALVRTARTAIETAQWTLLGELMTMNHGLLRALGVSSTELDALVDAALEGGALGAKLTGAGGGGAVIALADGGPDALLAQLRRAGYEAFSTPLGEPAP